MNWWRAYQFPSVHVPQVTTSLGGGARAEAANSPGHQGHRSGGVEGSHTNHSTSTSGRLVPVVIVGLRSLPRDSRRPSSASSPPSPEAGTDADASEAGHSTNMGPGSQSMPADEVDAITSSYVIIVLGGHYPPEHRYASATGSDDSNELDLLWYVSKSEILPFLILEQGFGRAGAIQTAHCDSRRDLQVRINVLQGFGNTQDAGGGKYCRERE